MYMLQERLRILQLGDPMLLDAPDVELDDARALDALVFSAMPSASSAAEPASNSAACNVEHSATSSAAHSVGAPSSPKPDNSAAQPVDCASEAEDPTAGEAAEDVDNMTDDLEITTLTNTTSLHDDWLHRGAFLADLDLHTYIAHVVRIPRPTKARVADIQRFENVSLR